MRSRLAEYLVARAVGADHRPRVEWDSHDVTTLSGGRLEVKASAYVQSWAQQRPSQIKFSGLRARTPTPDSSYSATATYNADVYVFALLADADHDSYDALDTTHWHFWVLPAAVVATHGCASLSLTTLRRLAGDAVPYDQLAATITSALASQPTG